MGAYKDKIITPSTLIWYYEKDSPTKFMCLVEENKDPIKDSVGKVWRTKSGKWQYICRGYDLDTHSRKYITGLELTKKWAMRKVEEVYIICKE